jgi:dihydrolipoamide dehydrogenase
MVVGEVAEGVDALVVGGGPGGYTAALRLADAGRRVTLVERDRVGGTCLHAGCIPSKTLLEVAAAYDQARHGADRGLHAHVELDMAAVAGHVGAVVEDLHRGVRSLLADAGVTVLSGTAAFTRPDRAVVDQGDRVTHLEFRDALVATGSVPVRLAVLPPDGRRVVDAAGALALDALPRSVAVVGGGYVGVELATAFHRLGAAVAVVERADRLLPELGPGWLGEAVTAAFRRRGIVVHLGATAAGLAGDLLVVETPDGPVRLDAALVVTAVGRSPATAGLGLDRAGARVDGSGHVRVGPDRRAAAHLWAIGDVTPGPALAHKATAEAEVAARSMCGEPAAFAPACIPQVVFGDPEVLSVGDTTAAVASAGGEPVGFRFPLAASARLRTLGRAVSADAHLELVADGAGTVRGVHAVGPHVGELAGEAALAIELAATVEDLAGTIHAHPTVAEALAEAAHGATGRPLHVRRSAGGARP